MPTKPTVPEWQRLQYPDEATFNRLAEEHPDALYNEETNEFRGYFTLAPWIRLGWPSLELWTKCKSIGVGKQRLARMPYADLKAKYPDRPGVAPEEQDFARLMRYWPDCYGFPFVEVVVTLEKDIIQINDLIYAKGRHRVPAPVGTELARMNEKSLAERLKAVLPREHAERTLRELKNDGAMVADAALL